MGRLLMAVIVAGGLSLGTGCSEGAPKSDPKLSGGAQPNPRLKPAEAGSGGQTQPKGSESVAGD